MRRVPEHVPRNANQRAAAAARDVHAVASTCLHPSGRPDRVQGEHRNAIEEMVMLRAAPGGLRQVNYERPLTAPRESERRGFHTVDAGANLWENRAMADLASTGGDDNRSGAVDADTRRRLVGQWRLAHARLEHAVAAHSAALRAWDVQTAQGSTATKVASGISAERRGLIQLERTFQLHCTVAKELSATLGMGLGGPGETAVDQMLSKFEQQLAAMVNDLREELRGLKAVELPAQPASLKAAATSRVSEQRRQQMDALSLIESIDSTEAASAMLERSILRTRYAVLTP